MLPDVRLIAFYLPQFHPIPENDKWWGPGFTEWTNVTRGRPMYKDHYQPRRPGELGYYDLRVKEVRYRQVELARKHGIHGFCYHYYWFSGRRLLERPLDLMLADSELDFPFCICWANENWSRRWDGSEHDILMDQSHAPEDAARFIRDLAPVLRDPRYITVDGAPILLVYRPAIIPALRGVLRAWRETAGELEIPRLHLCGVQSFGYTTGLEDGFDAMVEFPPHSMICSEITDKIPGVIRGFTGKIYPYSDIIRYSVQLGSGIRLPVYRGIMAGWDNTARRGKSGHIFHGATPEHYEVWLRRLIHYTRKHHEGDHRLVFVNSWNEWAEGAYLEPDERYGCGFLQATARAVFGVPDAASLIRTLRQISDGNEEAQNVLDQLDYALKINERIVELVETRGLAPAALSRDGYSGRFRPVEQTSIKLPKKMISDGVIGHLDAVNTPNYESGVTLNRAYDVFLQGWIASKRIKAGPTSPIVFQLTNLESGARYIAQVASRVRREDVASELNRWPQRFRRRPASSSLYSGYRAYLNIAAVQPGSYALEAILPTSNGHTGLRLPLHSSLLVL
jgi:Glycosyltransferase WbsX